MSTQVLVRNAEQYAGKYITLKNFTDKTVVSSGRTPMIAMRQAKRKGYDHPVILYIPKKNMVNIY